MALNLLNVGDSRATTKAKLDAAFAEVGLPASGDTTEATDTFNQLVADYLVDPLPGLTNRMAGGTARSRINAAITALNEGGGVAQARLVPGDVDTFYVVITTDSGPLVARFEKDVVASSGGSNLGGGNASWRPTGFGVGAVPASATWVSDDVGAQDIVANFGGVAFGSYHGLGTSGLIHSQTITMDGVTADPTVAVSGDLFELRNDVTASDGTNSFRRDLSFTNDIAGLKMTVHSASTVGTLARSYCGMPIGSGTGFDEVAIVTGTLPTTIPPFKTGVEGVARLGVTRSVALRNSANGYFHGASSDLPDRTGFAECRVDHELATSRTKAYLSNFSDLSDLAGAEIVFAWGIGDTGAAALPTNLLADANWTTGASPLWAAYSQSNGTVVKSGTDLTMTYSGSGTSNLRAHAPIQTCVTGQEYVMSVDLVSQTGTGSVEVYAGSNVNGSNSTPAPAISSDNVIVGVAEPIGQLIMLFTATQDDPNQRFAVRNASSSGTLETVWRNPVVFDVAA